MLADIQAIDSSLDKAVDAYNAAQMKLDAIRAEEKVNQRHLVIARSNFKNAQATLASRLLALYKSGDDNVLEVLLGSRSLSELLERVDTISRVSAEDTRVISEIRSYRAEIKRREKKLAIARVQQEQVLAERAERRRHDRRTARGAAAAARVDQGSDREDQGGGGRAPTPLAGAGPAGRRPAADPLVLQAPRRSQTVRRAALHRLQLTVASPGSH